MASGAAGIRRGLGAVDSPRGGRPPSPGPEGFVVCSSNSAETSPFPQLPFIDGPLITNVSKRFSLCVLCNYRGARITSSHCEVTLCRAETSMRYLLSLEKKREGICIKTIIKCLQLARSICIWIKGLVYPVIILRNKLNVHSRY